MSAIKQHSAIWSIKVNPLKGLSFAAYVPFADGNFTGYGDTSIGTVGYTKRSAEDAYSNVDFAAKYVINGIGADGGQKRTLERWKADSRRSIADSKKIERYSKW
jgi:hypothetical protein